MNITLLRRPGQVEELVKSFHTHKPRLSFIDILENPNPRMNKYYLREQQCTSRSAPIMFIYPLIVANNGTGQLPFVIEAAATSARHGNTFFLLVAPARSKKEEVEDQVWETSSNTFILHGCDFATETTKLVSLLINTLDSGMFGRYRVIQGPGPLEICPLRRTDQLFKEAA